jgi:hypothetical protein
MSEHDVRYDFRRGDKPALDWEVEFPVDVESSSSDGRILTMRLTPEQLDQLKLPLESGESHDMQGGPSGITKEQQQLALHGLPVRVTTKETDEFTHESCNGRYLIEKHENTTVLVTKIALEMPLDWREEDNQSRVWILFPLWIDPRRQLLFGKPQIGTLYLPFIAVHYHAIYERCAAPHSLH